MSEDKEDEFNEKAWSNRIPGYDFQPELTPLEKLSLADLVALRNMGYATVQKEIDKRIKEIFG